jgi:invasion protein IalB
MWGMTMFWRQKARGLAGALVLCVLGAPGLHAADKPKPTPEASPKKDAEPVSSDPQLTTATFGDWVERCQRVTAAGETRKVCEVALTVTATGQNAPLAELALGRARKADPLRLTLVLPVNVGFPGAPKLTLEGGEALELVWRQCVPAGCFAEAGISGEQLSALREAKGAKVESKAAGGQAFNFAVSLRGLPQALDAMAREP